MTNSFLSLMERLPGAGYYARSRGWPFVLSWAHRVTGIILVFYLLVHVYTLSALPKPGDFASKMAFYDNRFFSFLEWALAIPLIFHASNGARLILFEIFHVRDDTSMIRWVGGSGSIFILTLGYLMIAGDQQVSIGFFWLVALILSATAGYVVFNRVWKTRNRSLWKLQRISGALLLPLLCAHMFFMHMNYLSGHDAETVRLRMQGYFTKGIDFILVVFVLFHGAYGLCSVIDDYIENPKLRKALEIVVILLMVACGWAGVKLLVVT